MSGRQGREESGGYWWALLAYPARTCKRFGFQHTQWFLRMKTINWGHAVVAGLMACAFGVFGFFGAARLLQKYVRGEFAWWHSLGTPPEQPVSFVGLHPHVNGGRDADVYVETATGAVYRYACCSQRQAAWHETKVIDELWPGLCDRDDPGEIIPRHALTRLPVQVIACTEILWEKNPNDVSYFVLLEDHSVWWWREYVSLGTVVVWLLGGAAAGVSLGVWLAFLLTRHCLRPPRRV